MTKTLVERPKAVEIVTALGNGTFIDDPQRPRCSPEEQSAIRALLAAASRIEELERALGEIVGRGGDYFTGDDHAWCRQRARQALSDKG
jgi:hypothetical protein